MVAVLGPYEALPFYIHTYIQLFFPHNPHHSLCTFASDEQEPVCRARKSLRQRRQATFLKLQWQHRCLENVAHVVHLFGPMKDGLRGQRFPDNDAVIAACLCWRRLLRARHTGSCSSLAKVHKEWWWLRGKITVSSWNLALFNCVIMITLSVSGWDVQIYTKIRRH
jgi:hypothetical protein